MKNVRTIGVTKNVFFFSLYLTKVFNENVKFLVFAHHQVMMNAIESLVKSLNKKFIKIDGHTSTDDRKTLVDTFQEDNEYVCAILSLTAANTGITLTAAQLVIFAELYWNPTVSILNKDSKSIF